MSGSFRAKPPQPDQPATVRLVTFAEDKPHTFNSLLCDGVTAIGLPSFASLFTLHGRLQQDHPGVRVLASLDDLGQAGYTSGHCVNAHDLDRTEDHDLSGLPPEVFENGEHQGYFSTPAEFPIRLANLLKRAADVELSQMSGLLPWGGDDGDLVMINRSPEDVLRIACEEDILFQFVPVDTAAKSLAAFPNGYFTADLNPAQNYILARHLETQYGLALFGVGSRYLGFRRTDVFPDDVARKLANELAAFYADTPDGASSQLAELLTGRDWLLIRYTES